MARMNQSRRHGYAPRAKLRLRKNLTERYQEFFVPHQHLHRIDDEGLSLEQPSPYRWVPSETTYGIGSILPVEQNA